MRTAALALSCLAQAVLSRRVHLASQHARGNAYEGRHTWGRTEWKQLQSRARDAAVVDFEAGWNPMKVVAVLAQLLMQPAAAWRSTGHGCTAASNRLRSQTRAASPALGDSQVMLPERPSPMNAGTGRSIIAADDVAAVRDEVVALAKARDAERALSDEVKALCAEAMSAMQYGMFEDGDKARDAARKLLDEHEAASPHNKTDRPWTLSAAYENVVKAEAFSCFLKTGAALSRGSLGDMFEDTEYIAGVIMMCQELSHYALRRATALDTTSVDLCRRFISEVKAELLGFDFRNGPLRKRFDGVKYAERRCQDLLYDLSFAESSASLADADGGTSLVDKEEWEKLRQGYEEYDQKRELVIKACRDVQKAAKQAIYAAQRGDLQKTQKLTESANVGAKAIWEEHIHDNPGLRYGSFQGALEELAEAELFLEWLKHLNAKDGDEGDADMALLPLKKDLACGLLSAQEYLGALSDYTGEVGRVAVEAATRREGDAVQECLRSIFAAHAAIASAPLVGKQLEKLDAAKRNLRKLETIQYDLAVRADVKGSAPSISDTDDDGTFGEAAD